MAISFRPDRTDPFLLTEETAKTFKGELHAFIQKEETLFRQCFNVNLSEKDETQEEKTTRVSSLTFNFTAKELVKAAENYTALETFVKACNSCQIKERYHPKNENYLLQLQDQRKTVWVALEGSGSPEAAKENAQNLFVEHFQNSICKHLRTWTVLETLPRFLDISSVSIVLEYLHDQYRTLNTFAYSNVELELSKANDNQGLNALMAEDESLSAIKRKVKPNI
ncbi:MAG TPA: hypothetical protein VLG76_07215 [Rhabdochlamydiaceae bacterium]|nr:hypothetical protein [Rhabdochlamydiaceae bacterium]